MKNLTPTEKALETWYKPDNSKHFDLLHPVLKLAGECGEFLDLAAKSLYKPGFNWLDIGKDGLSKQNSELGDISYYLRIIDYIQDNPEKHTSEVDNIIEVIVFLNFLAARIAWDLVSQNSKSIPVDLLNKAFEDVLESVDIDYDEIIRQNY